MWWSMILSLWMGLVKKASHYFRDADGLGKKNKGKVVVQKVGSGLKNIGKHVLKPSVVVGDEDDHALYDIDEADDISVLLVSHFIV